MKRAILVILILAAGILTAQPKYSAINGKPGSFSRLGFGARGMGMGNAMSAVTEGVLVSYYNPALGAFQNGNSFQTSYSFLSLDRSLNFLSYTRKFEFGKKIDEEGNEKPRSTAGVSIGIINAGVSDIQERDSQGNITGNISTSENQFFLGLSNRFSEKFALGVAFKFYYYKLYEEVTSTTLGFDIGALYLLNDNITISFMLKDIASKYKWDTTPVYGQSGSNTEEKFPILKTIGVSYKFDEPNLIAAVEWESSNAESSILRFGAEYNIYEDLFLRAGLDKLNLNNLDIPVRPSFGFSYFYKLDSFRAGIDYAFVIEPYSSSDQHIVGININF